MKSQNLFSRKNKKKNNLKCCLLKILPSIWSSKHHFWLIWFPLCNIFTLKIATLNSLPYLSYKLLDHYQIMYTLISCHILRCLIWVYTTYSGLSVPILKVNMVVIFNTHWAISADNKLVIFFFPRFVCLFDLGLTSLSTIFQSYRDGVWLWQGAQCSLLECCLNEISCPRHFDMIFHTVTLYWHWDDQFQFLALLS